MRDYAKVSPKFWMGKTGKALRKHGLEAQLVGLYLLTSPHSTMLGLYTLPVVYIAHETGIGLEGARKGLDGCIEAGFCKYDDDTEMVWVIEMAHYQIAEKLSPKDNQCLGVRKAYADLIENPFLSEFYEKYAEDFHLQNKRGIEAPKKAPPKGVSKTLGSQEQEQEQEQEQDKPFSSAGADGEDDEEAKEPEPPKPFDQFWEAYPHKVDKIEARKVWAKLKPDAELVAQILAAVEAQKSGDQWMRDNGQYIPGPARWLRGGRWLDEVRAYVAPPPKLPPGWWETKEGMAAAGKMLDPPLTPIPGEYPKDFAQRIRVALGQVDQPPARAQDAAPPAAPYVPPAPPPEVQLTPEQQEARREEFREAMAKLKQRAGQAGVPGSP